MHLQQLFVQHVVPLLPTRAWCSLQSATEYVYMHVGTHAWCMLRCYCYCSCKRIEETVDAKPIMDS